MLEAQILLIRQRMLSGWLAKAERGEVALPLLIGYVRQADGVVVLDPDEAVQHVVRLVFDVFARLATLNAVLRYLVDRSIVLQVRVRDGIDNGQLQIASAVAGDAAAHAAQSNLRRLLHLRTPGIELRGPNKMIYLVSMSRYP
jgi:hypothetical protein